MTVLLFGYVLISIGQVISYGRLEPHSLVLVLLGVGTALWAVFSSRNVDDPPTRPMLVLGVSAILLTAILHNPLTYCSVSLWPPLYRLALLLGLVLTASYLFLPAAWRIWHHVRFAILILLIVGGRIAVPFLSPTPGEDVWFVQQEAAAAALSGVDPYSVAYTQIFSPEVYELFGYKSGFHYPPMSLIPILIPYWLFEDIRWTYVAVEIFLLLGVWLLARRALGRERRGESELIVCLWGFNTSVLFVLEHSWTEPFGLALLMGFVLLSFRKVMWPAAICLAAFFSYKQYTMLLFPLIFFLPNSFPVVASFVIINVVSFTPWLLGNPQGLVDNMMEPWKARPRADGLSLAAVWLNIRQSPMPDWVSAGFLLFGMSSAFTWIARNKRGILLAVFTVLAALFVTAKQSFCNYYYFLSFIALMAALLKTSVTRDDAGPTTRAPAGSTTVSGDS